MPSRDEAKAAIRRILQTMPIGERYHLLVELNEAAQGAQKMNEDIEFERRREHWRRVNKGEEHVTNL